jgi:ABC-type spermidine/putrescine transport system permease subunit II
VPRTRLANNPSASVLTRVKSAVAWVLFIGVYVFLYAPLVTIGVFAFNDSTIQALPWAGFTLQWFLEIPGDESLIAAIRFGLLVSAITVVLAGALGTLFAVIVHTVRSRATVALQGALLIPVVVPGMVLGLSLAIFFRVAGLTPGLWTVVLGHLTFTAPIVTVLVLTRLGRIDPSLTQASMDLGAKRLQTFWNVTWPQVRTAVFAACLLALTLSFDEVIVTYFLVGTQPTLPVFIWGQTRFGFTPEINAIVTLIGAVSIMLIVVAARVLERDIDPGSPPPDAEPANGNATP